MEELFCETHEVFELFIADQPGEKKGVTLNELTQLARHKRTFRRGNIEVDWEKYP
jgi:hypothetical protein